MNEDKLRPIVEALIYLADEPVTVASMIELLGEENEIAIRQALSDLLRRYASPEHGIEIKEIADGYKMATKPEHHAWVQKFLKYHTPPIRLSLPALETLAVIAYRQPVTLPEIQQIRGVNAAAVMKTLVDKKLVTAGGRKNVVGRPILYKTTRDFLLQFGLRNLGELPSLEEYEELAQASLEGVAVVGEPESEPGAAGAVGRRETDTAAPDTGKEPTGGRVAVEPRTISDAEQNRGAAGESGRISAGGDSRAS